MKDMRTPAITLMTNKTEANNDVTEWISVEVSSPESTAVALPARPVAALVWMTFLGLARLSRSMTRSHAVARVSSDAFSIKQCSDTLTRRDLQLSSPARKRIFADDESARFPFPVAKITPSLTGKFGKGPRTKNEVSSLRSLSSCASSKNDTGGRRRDVFRCCGPCPTDFKLTRSIASFQRRLRLSFIS